MNDELNIFELYLENTEQQKSPTMHMDANGSKRWKLHGELHRLDGPAVIRPDGYKAWWQHGELHRDGGPAIEYADGTKAWCQHGELHRLDGPAMEYADGDKVWYMHGKAHRIDGPAIEYADGNEAWYIDGTYCENMQQWARLALKYEGLQPTDEMIEQKIQQVMQQDLFS